MLRGAIRRKIIKTAVLPRLKKKEHGGDSSSNVMVALCLLSGARCHSDPCTFLFVSRVGSLLCLTN